MKVVKIRFLGEHSNNCLTQSQRGKDFISQIIVKQGNLASFPWSWQSKYLVKITGSAQSILISIYLPAGSNLGGL